ncbi:sensor domain-containing diguanylate cyclase [Lichenifustis flavocetrariae]|uniref:Sensor domain-containing diguanylate cyclase n=1 Tax=Lichenifustis flavocetrariae TaxID=2949735 RepID=A0AA41YZ32_9HYPH|nr:sensor domain-containing diguanylate cyclase [Lichenifustis flavocetrariae]MCW6509930.1 sensor domain-containing diguanylate cyclase [Lichenifustis flavocetrariae]
MQQASSRHATSAGPSSLDGVRPEAAVALSFDDLAQTFQLAPVSLWLEDFSGVKAVFDRWRAAGIYDLGGYLRAYPSQVEACSSAIRVLDVNAATLELFRAADCAELVANLHNIFRGDMLTTHIEELVQLWNGEGGFQNQGVNYSLDGRRIDIQIKGKVLPGFEDDWSRVLVAIKDVTERENAVRLLAASDTYARGLFEHSPVSLWVEDFSAVKMLIDELRACGIEDFRTFTDVHPEFVTRCMGEIRVIDVNRHTLTLFGAPDKTTLYRRLADVFRDEMVFPFREQLIDLWHGKLFQQREVVNYALDGTMLHLHLQFSVLPGHETTWGQVQVALTDITARKKAEAYLEFLGKHDSLTKLHNRSFFVDEMNRLERRSVAPVTIVMLDLNGLKAANDGEGHAAGDALLRRVGEILTKAVDAPVTAARIGGDEFAVLMPHAGERELAAMMDNLHQIIELNNQFHSDAPVSLSIGHATSEKGERLESVARRADAKMYEEKRRHYAGTDPHPR